MKKDIFIKFANNAAKAKAKRLYKNITAEEVAASLQEEADAFTALAEQLAAEQEDSEALKVVSESLKTVQDAQKALQEKQENKRDLIDELAKLIIEENTQILGADIAEDAIDKIEKENK